MSSPNLFNEDYYEHGVKKQLSGYENYHWMPTRSFPEAAEICAAFQEHTIIDVGCAKGFLVHALRQLGKDAWGEDISEYAIANCHPRVTPYLCTPTPTPAQLVICKDVLEHVPVEKIPEMLEWLHRKTLNSAFFVIPLGDDDQFRIREYEIDKTHVTKKDEDWWIDQFRTAGFKLKRFSYNFGAIKEKWVGPYPYGNGFFVLEP